MAETEELSAFKKEMTFYVLSSGISPEFGALQKSFEKIPSKEARNKIYDQLEKNPVDSAAAVKKYLGNDPRSKLDELLKLPPSDFAKVMMTELKIAQPAPPSSASAPAVSAARPVANDGLGGAMPLGPATPGMAQPFPMTNAPAQSAAAPPAQVETPIADSAPAQTPVPAARSYSDLVASMPRVDAPDRAPVKMTITDEKSILQTTPGFRDTLNDRFKENGARIITRDHAAAENKNATLYSFMKEVESRVQGAPQGQAISATYFSEQMNNEIKGYSDGNIQKLAFETSGMQADGTGRPLQIATETVDGKLLYGPVQSDGVAATREILNVLDKYPAMGAGAVRNAIAGSKGPDGVIDPHKLAEGLRGKAWGEELAKNGFEGIDPVIAQQIRLDRMIDGASSEKARPGVAAALHRDVLENGSDPNSFTGFLEALRQMPDNETARKVQENIFARLKTPEDVEMFSKGFSSVRVDERTGQPARLAEFALKTIASKPNEIDSNIGMMVDSIAGKANEFSKIPAPALKGGPAAAELSPEMKLFAAQLKKDLGIDPAKMAGASAGIDAFALKLQPHMGDWLKNTLKEDPGFLDKMQQKQMEKDIKTFDGMKGDSKKMDEAVKGLNATVDSDPKSFAEKNFMVLAPAKPPVPSEPAPSSSPAGSNPFADLKKELGIKDDQQLKTSRDFDDLIQRAIKDQELMNALVDMKGMAKVKGADGKDVNPALDRLKKELAKNPDLFEEMNKVIDRNPRVARSVFNQIAHGKIDEGVAQFTQTASMNGFVDMITGFIDMIKPGLGAQVAGWIDGVRNRNPMLDSIASKIGGNLFDLKEAVLPTDKKKEKEEEQKKEQEKTAAPPKTALEQEVYDKGLQAQIAKSEADRLEQEKRIQALNNGSSPAPQGTPVNGDVVSNGLPPLPNGLGNTAKVGNGTTASPIFGRSAAGETPAPESPASRRDLSLEAAEREAARRLLMSQNI